MLSGVGCTFVTCFVVSIVFSKKSEEMAMVINLRLGADSFEKTLMLGKIEGRRRRGDRG